MKTWTVYEYARIYRDNSTRYSDSDLLLSDKQFDSLMKLILSSESNHDKIFRYGYERGREVLVCQNYVGVICLPDGHQIEILPKTHRITLGGGDSGNELISDDRVRLVKMLKHTRYLPGKVASSASLDITKMPLLDIFIELFLNDVASIVKKGVSRQYNCVEENLPYLKGKLLVSQQVRHNLIFQHRHYVAYDELTADRPENRLLRSALQWALRRVSGKVEHLCQELLFHFSDIPKSINIRNDLKAWQKGRHLRHYESVRPWLEMIFNEQSPISVDGSNRMLSLLFPMERVFEDYVALRLKKQFPDFDIQTQVKRKSLVRHTPRESGVEKKLFQLKPDLHIKTLSGVIIGDSKWKLINEKLPNKKYKISEGDIYQMVSYNLMYQKDNVELSEIWLIYPNTDSFTKRIPDFILDNGAVIKVLPFNIDSDELEGI